MIGQGYSDVELLLVNDGSTDESESICKHYQERHKNIKYFLRENSGVSSARSLGLGRAKLRYCVLLRHDFLTLLKRIRLRLRLLIATGHSTP